MDAATTHLNEATKEKLLERKTMTDTPKIGHNSAAVGEMIAEQPGLVFTEEGILEELLTALEKEVDEHEPDLTTELGRKEIARLAYGMSRQKTAIDDAGKALNEERRKLNAKVDEKRRIARERLDVLRDKAREPLTNWENEQARRGAHMESVRTQIERAANPSIAESTPEGLQATIEHIEGLEIEDDVFGELMDDVEAQRAACIQKLKAFKVGAEKAEADAGRLEELEAKEAARLAAEAEEKAKAKAKADEEKRLKAAEEKAAREAEERVAAETQRKLDEAKAKQEAAEAKAAEIAEEAEREAKAKADEQAARGKREKDTKHRRSIINSAVTALRDRGVDSEEAQQAIILIAAGEIPAVTITF